MDDSAHMPKPEGEEETTKPEITAPTFSGWLTKEGAVWRTWRRRWFVLQAPYLRYYKHEGDKEPVGTIDLQNSGHIRGVQYKKTKYAFQIQTPSRTYYMYGDSVDDRDKWVDALNNALSILHPETFKSAVQFTDFELQKLVQKFDDNEKIVQAKLRDDDSKYLVRVIDRKDEAACAWVEKYAAELIVLQRFDHPFVRNLKYFFQLPEKFWFVSEAVSGMKLSVVLHRGGALPFELVRFLGAEICLALEHIHAAGFMYPMLSPESVIVTDDGHACFVPNGKITETCRKNYRAPELYCGAEYTQAHDWWCFGCLLFELATAKPPFRGDSEEEMKYSVNNDPVALPSTIPQDGKNLIAKLLDRRPDKRLTDSGLIKRHDFFHSIDLELVYKKKFKPPVDVASLTSVLTNPQLAAMTPDKGSKDSIDSAFAGFTFVADIQENNAPIPIEGP